jgi:hypothetical protein
VKSARHVRHLLRNVCHSRNVRSVLHVSQSELHARSRDVSRVTEVGISAVEFNVKSPLTSQPHALTSHELTWREDSVSPALDGAVAGIRLAKLISWFSIFKSRFACTSYFIKQSDLCSLRLLWPVVGSRIFSNAQNVTVSLSGLRRSNSIAASLIVLVASLLNLFLAVLICID